MIELSFRMNNYDNQIVSTPDSKPKRTWSTRESPIDVSSDSSIRSPELKIAKITPKTMEEKIDQILLENKAINKSLDDINGKLDTTNQTVAECDTKYERLYTMIKSLDARLQKNEAEVESLRDTVIDLTQRSMKHNLIVYNLKESPNENCYETAKKFLINDMKIPRARIGADICVDIAHRLGKGTDRLLIIRFTTHRGRREALSFCGNLKGTNIYVREQLPPDMNQKAAAQLGTMKQLKGNASNKVKMVRDKLFLNGKLVDPKFGRNEIMLDCDLSDEVALEDITKSDTMLVNTNGVRGYYYEAEGLLEIKTALAKVQSDADNSTASHMIYAYRTYDGRDGYCDDREYGSSAPILKIMETKKKLGILIFCKFDGRKRLKAEERDRVIASIASDLLED